MSSLWLRMWLLGIKSMALHPLRSALTVLGIFIGVASVIWLLAIGEGISAKAQEQIDRLGTRNIMIRSLKPSQESRGRQNDEIRYGVTRADMDRIVSTIPTIEHELPIREIPRQFRYEHRRVEGRLVGCTPAYAAVNRLKVSRGRFLSPTDLMEERNYCVLAAEVAATLFPATEPLGKMLRVEDDVYEVVGVMKPRMPSAGIGGSLAAQDYSKDVYIPIDTLWRRNTDFVAIGGVGSFEVEVVELSQLTLQVDDVDNVMETSRLVRRTLEPHHRLPDFGITVPLELLEQARTTRLMFILFMGLIAAISLLVGGIGIMNIMLATVTERTREIGIRRALGAKQRDITRQFLAETVSLSIVGGLTGIVGGLFCQPIVRGIYWGLEKYMPNVMQSLPDVVRSMTPIIVPWSIPLAFAISVLVGILFGMYPARRAAKMDPIEALRHE